MKKTTTLLILLITIILSAKTPLTKDLLCNTQWEEGWQFLQDGFYCQPFSFSTGGGMVLGKYEIRKGKLYLGQTSEIIGNDPFEDKTNEYYSRHFEVEYTARLIIDKNSFRSSFYLYVEDIKNEGLPDFVRRKQSDIPKSTLISIDNTVAITLADSATYGKHGLPSKTTSNLSLRATPSSKGKRLPWYTIEEINHGESESCYKYNGLSMCKLSYLKKQTEDLLLTNLAYIPESTSIHAIARTYYKDTINGVADYWYYVDADNSGYTINGEGWVWGEFLKLQ